MTMKLTIKSAVLALLITAPGMAFGQDNTEVSDTLVVAEKARNITVTKTDEGLKITIAGYGDKHDNDYVYTSTSSLKNDSTESGIWNLNMLKAPSSDGKWSFKFCKRIYIGGTIDTEGPVNMAYWRSFEVGFLDFVGVEYSPWRKGPRFSIGAGYGYKHLSTHKDTDKTLFRDTDGNMTINPSPENTTDQLSSIGILHFDIPLMITQPFTKHWAVSVGASVNFNTYVTGSTKYKVLGENEFGLTPGHKVEETYKHLRQRPVTFDFMASVGHLDEIAFYARYSPMSVFKDGAGPKFKTLSLGLLIAF